METFSPIPGEWSSSVSGHEVHLGYTEEASPSSPVQWEAFFEVPPFEFRAEG